MEHDSRKREILQLLVENYISGAGPVSSSAVVSGHRALGLSPATVRAVMAELEVEGLLHQPHASAGRVPTEKGLRAFVDGLMSPKLRARDRSRLDAAASHAEPVAFPGELGRMLAGLSGQVAVVAVPRFLGSRFREVGFVRVGTGRFVAFFLSPGGLVQQKIVQLDFDLNAEELQQIQNFLNQKLANRSLVEVRALVRIEIEEGQSACDELQRRALLLGRQAIPEPEMDLHVDGTSHLANQPEFSDLRKLRSLLRAIEQRSTLLELLDRILDASGVKVILGSEHHVREMMELACVGGSWTSTSGRGLAVSLLGPARMDYERLVPMVGYATELFGRYWEQL